MEDEDCSDVSVIVSFGDVRGDEGELLVLELDVGLLLQLFFGDVDVQSENSESMMSTIASSSEDRLFQSGSARGDDDSRRCEDDVTASLTSFSAPITLPQL